MVDRSPFLASNDTLLNAASARIDPRTFVAYALDDEQARGGHKGVDFAQVLGFTRDNADRLVAAIAEGIQTRPAQRRGVDEYGSHFRVDLALTGANGRSAIVRTHWIYEPDTSTRDVHRHSCEGDDPVRKPRFPDVVRLTEEVSGYDDHDDDGVRMVLVPKGELGTILEEFNTPAEAYLMEFANPYGETITMVTLKPDQFDVVYPLGRRVPEQVGA